MPRTSARTSQTALQTCENGFARLDECIVHFQSIEDALSRCISGLICFDRHAGAIVTGETSYRAKVAGFTALFKCGFRRADLPEEVSDLFNRLREAEHRRNLLMHPIWDASIKQPTTLKREKNACRRNGFVRDLQHITLGELEETREVYEGLEKDTFYLTIEHSSDVAKRIP